MSGSTKEAVSVEAESEQKQSLKQEGQVKRVPDRGRDEDKDFEECMVHLRKHANVYFFVILGGLVAYSIWHIESTFREQTRPQLIVRSMLQSKEGQLMPSSQVIEESHSKPQHQMAINRQSSDNSQLIGSTTQNRQSQQSTFEHSPQQSQSKGEESPDTLFKPKSSLADGGGSGGLKKTIAGVGMQQRELAKRLRQLKYDDFAAQTELSIEQKEWYQKRYPQYNSFPQLAFCIVVPTYNNNKHHLHTNNMRSILMQDYSNYKIVFIDDASTDGTGDEVEALLNNQTKVPQGKITVVRNKEQRRAMPNLRMAATEHCLPQQIYVIVDGDDELVGRQVLRVFNFVFQTTKAWFVYSNFLNVKGSVGYSRWYPASVLKSNNFRHYPFVTSHLRAFYTQLFRNIRQSDLQDQNGTYFRAANDVAICVPVLEQAGGARVKYLQELTYFYNSNTGQNNHHLRLKEQKSNDRLTRRRISYQVLAKLMDPVEFKAVRKKRPYLDD